MKEHEGQWFSLELPEIIKVNQLIRRTIDVEGFNSWYSQLPVSEKCALIYALFEFAYQAGVDESIYTEALSAARIDTDHPLIETFGTFMGKNYPDWLSLHKWVMQLSEAERFIIFTFAVPLFGKAEGRVYRNELKEWCNHWWHRDLLDDRVVNSILNDPEFYLTAMKDDEKIKSRWRWLRGV